MKNILIMFVFIGVMTKLALVSAICSSSTSYSCTRYTTALARLTSPTIDDICTAIKNVRACFTNNNCDLALSLFNDNIKVVLDRAQISCSGTSGSFITTLAPPINMTDITTHMVTGAPSCDAIEIQACNRYTDELKSIIRPTKEQICGTVTKVRNCLEGCDLALSLFNSYMDKAFRSWGFTCESSSVTTPTPNTGYCNDLEIKSCYRYDDELLKIANPTLAQNCSTAFKIENCLKGCDEALGKFKARMQKMFADNGGGVSCDQVSRTDIDKLDSCSAQEIGSCTSILKKISKPTAGQICSSMPKVKNCLGNKGCNVALNLFKENTGELLAKYNVICGCSKLNSPGLCFILLMTVLCMAKHYFQQ
ncbi:uncharacterized protein LOC126832047 [Patella vulgata]|uniref:uncharacterized protein LOC126832047 n=1 Tax=Patella vulgata TaxID=6465 RepID=UPI00217FE9C9|nr:uncharacterized protein LOC126832047 [Patella vulgata]